PFIKNPRFLYLYNNYMHKTYQDISLYFSRIKIVLFVVTLFQLLLSAIPVLMNARYPPPGNHDRAPYNQQQKGSFQIYSYVVSRLYDNELLPVWAYLLSHIPVPPLCLLPVHAIIRDDKKGDLSVSNFAE